MRCFPLGVWLWKGHRWRDQLTTNQFRYSLEFQVLTDVSLMHLPPWTFGHQQDHILRCKHSLWSAAPWMPVNLCTFSSKDFAHSNSHNGHFSRWTFIRLPLNSSFLSCTSFWDRPKLATIPPGLFSGVLCLIPSTSATLCILFGWLMLNGTNGLSWHRRSKCVVLWPGTDRNTHSSTCLPRGNLLNSHEASSEKSF